MAFANRSTIINIYCPAIDKNVDYEIISHHNNNNRYASFNLSYRCCEMSKCPFDICKCKYNDGELTLRD